MSVMPDISSPSYICDRCGKTDSSLGNLTVAPAERLLMYANSSITLCRNCHEILQQNPSLGWVSRKDPRWRDPNTPEINKFDFIEALSRS